MKKAATIKDVAKALGVSVSTVSRVMNGQDRVSSEMRKKVTDTVRRLGYVPSHAAVSVVKKQTQLIAALLPDLRTPLFSGVLEGIEQAARAKGYFTMVVLTNGSRDEEQRFLNSTMGHFVDAIAVVPSTPDLSHFSLFSKPIIFMEHIGDDADCDSVAIDNFRGAYVAAEHMLQMGHSKIAIISGDRAFGSGRDRYWGFEQALRNRRVKINLQYVCAGGWAEKDGYAAAFRLMNLSDPPTAIFAAGEQLSRGAIMALHDLKLRLGTDVSLIGFEDNDLASASNPALTVVSRPTAEIGKISAGILIERISAGSPPVARQKVSLPPKLVARSSVRDISTSEAQP
jgi:DNA-binding LacI/PurR family transcriptional regulator